MLVLSMACFGFDHVGDKALPDEQAPICFPSCATSIVELSNRVKALLHLQSHVFPGRERRSSLWKQNMRLDTPKRRICVLFNEHTQLFEHSIESSLVEVVSC
jgi:hypothetical protein